MHNQSRNLILITGLGAVILWMGWSSAIFENRLLNVGYEITSMSVGIFLALVLFFLFSKIFSRTSGYIAIALFVLSIGVAASGKIMLDQLMREKTPALGPLSDS